ncbi:unnamed protein product [Spirodela intermedia]|uniref:Gag1-like clamp domain-containing protein n=1 Tax=Spirodela intermedia TaxID=51605 RepID=A0A7I8JAE2_SPIIN|nr:unnamed protein product [Spirodela intermedia]CAA6666403.1 unnamed protein product [Spirodela intermedia]
MDNNGLQSQRNLSSISTCVQTQDLHVTGNASNPSDFVNHGLILWNQTRQHWIGCSKPDDHTKQAIKPRLSWNATYESLIGSERPFLRPVPLSELVDLLVDEWEEEGMYD